ncbi:MAG: methylenetetrahydrofolate reductase [Clostridia bacterium]|nr:methylenetetrahydrofolate reductase [Clostridia bacterium]
MNEKSLQELLEQKARPILVEFDPPRQTAPQDFLAGAQELCRGGADVITIADCPIGRASVNACMLAARLKREFGLQVLPHMACRDRNLNAILSLLLGLDMESIHSVLLVTGDPVAKENRDHIKGVFQLTARTLAQSLRDLEKEGQLQPFFLCGALNINARNFDAELIRAQRKEECGIQAFLTQPVCSAQAEENVRRARGRLHGFLLGGLFPIVSYKNARFLQKEVNGVQIDEQVIRAYEGLDRERGEALARKLCGDTAARIGPFVDGFYIMTPFRRVALVKTIIGEIKAIEG